MLVNKGIVLRSELGRARPSPGTARQIDGKTKVCQSGTPAERNPCRGRPNTSGIELWVSHRPSTNAGIAAKNKKNVELRNKTRVWRCFGEFETLKTIKKKLIETAIIVEQNPKPTVRIVGPVTIC